MQLFIPHTPLAIVITTVLAFIVCVKIFLDMKEIRASRQVHSSIMKFVTKKNVPRISIIIELRKTADTLIPLLDHLYNHDYPRLEVVIVVKHTAGKFAQSKLMYYRRKYQRKDMKVIKHSKGMDIFSVTNRYVTSPFVMQLHPNDKLSNDFFTHIALELLDKRIDVITPRRHVSAGKTILSALNVVFGVWKHILTAFHTAAHVDNRFIPGKVYRRRSLLGRAQLKNVYVSRVAVHQFSEKSWKALFQAAMTNITRYTQSIKVRVGILTGLVAGIGLAIYVWDQDTLLLAEFMLLVYSAVFGLLIIRLKGYSLSERVSLLLFGPFSMTLVILLALVSFVAVLYKQVASIRFKRRAFVVRGKRRSLAIPKL